MADVLSSPQVELIIRKLISFSTTRLSEEEQIRVEMNIGREGTFQWLDFRWWIDYHLFLEDEDEYEKNFGKRTYVYQLEDYDDTDSSEDDDEGTEFDGARAWLKKIQLMKDFLGPQFKVHFSSLNANLNDARGCVSAARTE